MELKLNPLLVNDRVKSPKSIMIRNKTDAINLIVV